MPDTFTIGVVRLPTDTDGYYADGWVDCEWWSWTPSGNIYGHKAGGGKTVTLKAPNYSIGDSILICLDLESGQLLANVNDGAEVITLTDQISTAGEWCWAAQLHCEGDTVEIRRPNYCDPAATLIQASISPNQRRQANHPAVSQHCPDGFFSR